jgi:hypothetical protein
MKHAYILEENMENNDIKSDNKSENSSRSGNIYDKLSKVRILFQNMNVPKSERFETDSDYALSDLQSVTTNLFEELKLCSLMHVGSEEASLTVINNENPEERIVFSSPISPLAGDMAALSGKSFFESWEAGREYMERLLYLSLLIG